MRTWDSFKTLEAGGRFQSASRAITTAVRQEVPGPVTIPDSRLTEAEQELLRARLYQASAIARLRAAHLTEEEVAELIERARDEVHQETATP